MSKTSRKTHNEVEHLQGEIRRLKSENRNLKKRVKELERWEHVFLEESEPEVVLEEVERCPNCGDGELIFNDFKYVQLMTCSACDYKEKLNGKKKVSTQGSQSFNNSKAKTNKSLLARKKKGTRRSKG